MKLSFLRRLLSILLRKRLLLEDSSDHLLPRHPQGQLATAQSNVLQKKGEKNLLSVLHRQELLLLLHPLRLQVHLQDHQPLPVHLQLYASVNSFQKTTLLQEKIFTFLQIIFILTILIININCNQIIITVLMMLIRTRTSALRKQRNC